METTLKKSATSNQDIYQKVTETVIQLLEEGTVIWRCSWNGSNLPKNFLTQTYYHGWNVFLLNFHSAKHQYPTTDYLTFKQANQLGALLNWVRKESK